MNKKWQALKTTVGREKFMVFTSIAVMTVTFLVLGLFLSSAVGFQTALKALEEQAQITIFFKDDFPEEEILKIRGHLEADRRISGVSYISKEDAFKIFTEMNKNEPILLEAISANILPASLEIRAEKVTDLDTLASEFKSIDGAEEVKFFKDVIDTFRHWTKVISIVGLVLVTLFLLGSFSIVMATLQVSIHLKGDEIGILRLVGASKPYVRGPFIFQGIFFGVVSALLASLIMVLTLIGIRLSGFVGSPVELVILPFVVVPAWLFLLILPLVLVLVGVLLGYIGSSTAVKKYLKS